MLFKLSRYSLHIQKYSQREDLLLCSLWTVNLLIYYIIILTECVYILYILFHFH